MKSCRNEVVHEIVINKSRFICLLIPISSDEEVPLHLRQCKERFPAANHYCFAYIVDEKMKASDDGEPSKTAGMPILNVIEKNGLDHLLAVVVRYFGGIKLGAGGLVRAYSNAVVEALKQADIVEKMKAPYYQLSFDYHYTKTMDYFLKSHQIDVIDKRYEDRVHYQCFIVDPSLLEALNETFNAQISINLLGYDDLEIHNS